jgi:hypothetical protein
LTLTIVVLLGCGTAAAKVPAPPPRSQPAASRVAASRPASTSQPAVAGRHDPFLQLRVVVPRAKLPPMRSVRVRDKREETDRSREGKVTITIGSRPRGARVYYGGKLLGTTPFGLTARKGSTPYDVVLKKGGYMTLHTRIRRKVSRSYFFRMSPAKIR